MYLKINLMLFILLSSCKINYRDLTFYEKVKESVKSESIVMKYTKEELKANEISVFIYDETIPFNLNALETDIIKKKYIKGFNAFSNHNKQELAIIKKISDSLSERDSYLNKGFVNKKIEIKKNIDINAANYILFFSNVVDNYIYAQLLPYNSDINDINDLNTMNYGIGFSFLFELDNNKKILSKYSGVVHLN